MSTFTDIFNTVVSSIKTNNKRSITAVTLQPILTSIVNQFKNIANGRILFISGDKIASSDKIKYINETLYVDQLKINQTNFINKILEEYNTSHDQGKTLLTSRALKQMLYNLNLLTVPPLTENPYASNTFTPTVVIPTTATKTNIPLPNLKPGFQIPDIPIPQPLNIGDTALLTNQTDWTENGLYEITADAATLKLPTSSLSRSIIYTPVAPPTMPKIFTVTNTEEQPWQFDITVAPNNEAGTSAIYTKELSQSLIAGDNIITFEKPTNCLTVSVKDSNGNLIHVDVQQTSTTEIIIKTIEEINNAHINILFK